MIFSALRPPEPDAIVRLMQLYRDDPRPNRIDLGVGVYRDAMGRTPVMRAVTTAETRMLARQDTKTYTSLAGDPAFLEAMERLLLAGSVPSDRLASVATPGGTGALRQILELVRMVNPQACVHLPRPSWANHAPLVRGVGLRLAEYSYFDPETGGLDRDGMMADLGRVATGDVVVLHGACHNPTGVDPDPSDWAEIAALLSRAGAVPLIDVAYLGLGEGLDADAGGMRHLCARMPEVLVAASGSKSFGLYRERVGLAMAVTSGPEARGRVAATLAWLNRQNFAFPPDHGARVVTEILGNPELRHDWQTELAEMRTRIASTRSALVRALSRETGTDRFGCLAAQKGMFSLLPLSPEAVQRLREAHAIYMVADGRANLAGLLPGQIDRCAAAVAQVLAG